MPRLFYLLALAYFLFSGQVVAQNAFGVTDLKGPAAKEQFLDELFDAHQRFRQRESGVLLRSGYHSSAHLALLDSIRQTDEVLRGKVEAYLVEHGFPDEPSAPAEGEAYRELLTRFLKTPPAGNAIRYYGPSKRLTPTLPVGWITARRLC